MGKGFRPLNIIFSIALSLFFICLSVKLTLSFRQLYYFDIDHLNIIQNSGLNIDKETLKKNYDILIDYSQRRNIHKLSMPNFPMSAQGEIHFAEVKALFMKFNYLMYISAFISVIGLVIGFRNKNLKLLKYSSIISIIFPIILAIPFSINFDRSFTVFHELFFRNNYWEFDPVTDPIINVLPQEFFFHCAVMILLIIFASSIISFLIYKFFSNNKKALA